MLSTWKQQVAKLKRHIFTLFLAYKDPRTPWYAKFFAAGVVAYALSPIDLIPDFIPLLGYLDELILIPFAVALAIKLIPTEVWKEAEEKSLTETWTKRKSRIVALIIICIWLAVLIITARILWRFIKP